MVEKSGEICIIVKFSHGHKGWMMWSFSLTTAVCGFHIYKVNIAGVSFL